jgi:hypothetical protein
MQTEKRDKSLWTPCVWSPLLVALLAACSSGETNGTTGSDSGTAGSGGMAGSGGAPTAGSGDQTTAGASGSGASSGGTSSAGGSSSGGSPSAAGTGGSAGSGGSGTGGNAAGGSSGGGGAQPDPACLAFCASSDRTCGGPDAEAATSSAITATTPTGCSLTVELAVSGTVEVDIDCTAEEACVENASGCLGTPGMCYAAEVTDTDFSYRLDGCLQGGLWCTSS